MSAADYLISIPPQNSCSFNTSPSNCSCVHISFLQQTTTTVYFNETSFSQCTGVNLAYGLPTTFSSTLTCPKHLPYKVPSFSYLLSTLLSISSWAYLSLHHHLPAVSQILFIQHNSSLLSTWPNHLSLFHRITSPMSSIASMLLTHSLLFLSLKLTPVIHLNILISLLCILLICIYLCWPCLTAIQHCRSYACCIDDSILTSDSSLFL